jgi:hypothetical protein
MTTLPLCDKPVFADASIRKTHNALKISRLRAKRETTHPVVLAGVDMQHSLPMPALASPWRHRISRHRTCSCETELKNRLKAGKKGKKPIGSQTTMWNDGNNAERKPSTPK